MNARTIILFLVSAGILISLWYSFSGGGNDDGYIREIERDRTERESYLKTSTASPFRDKMDRFHPLAWYKPDPAYRIQADLEPVKSRTPRTLATSDGSVRTYLTYGWASFDMGNLRHRLLIMEVLDSGPQRGTLFLAFTDETSGSETYGAGRYMDLPRVPGATTIVLDFNKAYNPYCAYNDTFSCPLPPAENNLRTAIRAGEKDYH